MGMRYFVSISTENTKLTPEQLAEVAKVAFPKAKVIQVRRHFPTLVNYSRDAKPVDAPDRVG